MQTNQHMQNMLMQQEWQLRQHQQQHLLAAYTRMHSGGGMFEHARAGITPQFGRAATTVGNAVGAPQHLLGGGGVRAGGGGPLFGQQGANLMAQLAAVQQLQQQQLLSLPPQQQAAAMLILQQQQQQQPPQQHLQYIYQLQQQQQQHKGILQLFEEVFFGLVKAARQQGDAALEIQMQVIHLLILPMSCLSKTPCHQPILTDDYFAFKIPHVRARHRSSFCSSTRLLAWPPGRRRKPAPSWNSTLWPRPQRATWRTLSLPRIWMAPPPQRAAFRGPELACFRQHSSWQHRD